MSQSRQKESHKFFTNNTKVWNYNFKKHDDQLIDYKTPQQDNQKIVEGFYHPKAFDPSLTEAIKNNSLFNTPYQPQDPFKTPELPIKNHHNKK